MLVSNQKLGLVILLLFLLILPYLYNKQPNTQPVEDKPHIPKKIEKIKIESVPSLQVDAKSINEAFEKSEKSQKNILIYFWADWCGPCRKMKSETFQDKDVKKNLQKYVYLSLNYEVERVLAGRYNVHSLPCFIIVNQNGKILETRYGWHSAVEFNKFLSRNNTFINGK